MVHKDHQNLPPIISTGNIWSSKDAINCMGQGSDFIGVARVGIPYPDWPKNIRNVNYDPSRGPFTVKQLEKAKLSKPFLFNICANGMVLLKMNRKEFIINLLK